MFDFLKRKKLKAPITTHDNLLSSIKQIRVERIGRVFSPNMSMLGIRVSYRTIQEYNQFIKQLSDALVSKNDINMFLFRNTPSPILLRDWFVNQTGHYLNAVEQIETFKEHSSLLIKRYIELEEQLEKTMDGLVSRKIIHVGPVINQIKEIVEQLITVTKYESTDSAIRTNF